MGLWPNALLALESIGLRDKAEGLARRMAGSGIKRPDGTWLYYQPMDAVEKRWGATFIAVHRAELQQLLSSQVGPAAIHLGARCSGFTTRNGALYATLGDGRRARADILVGADGAYSVVRAALLGPVSLRYSGYTAVRSITRAGSVPLPRDGVEFWGRGVRFGFAPTSGERIIWYATWWRNAATTTMIARAYGMLGEWDGRLACAGRDGLLRATPPSVMLRQLDLVVGRGGDSLRGAAS